MVLTGAKLLVLGVFLASYVLIILLYKHKLIVVAAAVAALLALRVLSPQEALRAVSWNVVLLYFGMLLVGEVFLYSKMPDYLATLFTSRARGTAAAATILCLFTGLLSIALENVAVVLLVAPVAMSIARRSGINPVPLFIGMAISSNLQGAATLIGDPPSMLLAGHARLSFNDFFVYSGRPGIFFAVQVGAILSALVLLLFFRRDDRRMPSLERHSYDSLVPTLLIGLLVVALVLASSLEHNLEILAGLLCVLFGLASFLWYLAHSRGRHLKPFLKALDWQTGLFLIGVFVLVQSLTAVGLLEDIAAWMQRVAGGRPLVVFLLLVWVSVALSAFIDNVPYLMAMLPVVGLLAQRTAVEPYALYVGLLLGASVGGNITPIGASANIVAVGILKKHGYESRFFQFVRMGLPFTLVAVVASSLFVWLLFGGHRP
jgi:Na+/H+ antiporter NhaD/arsenite permease-like protein